MKYLYFLLLIFLFNLNGFALSLSKARLFERAVKENACSYKLLKELRETSLKEPFLLLFLDDCTLKGDYPLAAKAKGVKNPYGKFELALALRRAGKEKEAREIFKELFSRGDFPSEDVLTANLKDPSFLFEPKVLRVKVWRLAALGNTDEALFYLSFLRKDPYYSYLLAYTYLKAGKYRLARELFKTSTVPKSSYYLLFLSKTLPQKLLYYQEVLNLPLSLSLKRRTAVYALDYFFRRDFSFFRRALKLTYRRGLKDIYYYYRDRYRFFINSCSGKVSDREPQKWWKVACGRKKEFPKGINFYSLLLNPPKKFPYDRKKVFSSLKLKDPGLNFLYSKGYCSLLTLIEKRTPQTALLNYLCGNYKRGIEFALPFKGSLKKNPYLLVVLYPNPPLFKNDLVSLAIARQESLFELRALSRTGAIGLMQIMPSTGKEIARRLKVKGFKVSDLYKGDVNYRFGSYYIHSLLKRFKLFPLAAAAYNCGPGRVKRALKLYGPVNSEKDVILFTDIYLPFAETRGYVKRTLVNLYYYSNLYGTGKEWKTFLKP
ncbi:transglycosylase SLT domain-containing protein [Thermovibrio sp.]